MANHQPVTHVLDRSNYSRHTLIPLPSSSLPPHLPPNSIRIRSKIIGLTTNNLSYARRGDIFGWYDIYPLPTNTPAPYNDSTQYARIAAWGYAEILSSTVPGIIPGQSIFGFLPISSRPEDICIDFAQHNGNVLNHQLVVTNAHRQHVWNLYNRYQVHPPLADLEAKKGADSLGYDALMQGLFGTAYNMNKYAFAWTQENRIHPIGSGEWTSSDANLRSATIIILNASGKTGMSFAYNLRHNRPEEHQPARVIGVGSRTSIKVIEKSGFFDELLLNSAAEATAGEIAQHAHTTKRVVLLDFGAREGVNENWSSALHLSGIPFTHVTIGSEVLVQESVKAKMKSAPADTGLKAQVHASNLREKGIEAEGARYFDAFEAAFEEFKGRVGGLRLQWGEGMQDWAEGWEALCRDEVRADVGLVYRV